MTQNNTRLEFDRRELLIALGVIIALLGRVTRAFTYLFTPPDVSSSDRWVDLGLAPGGKKEYPPQGMVHTGEELYFTNHWNNRASSLYRLNPDTGDVMAQQMMPDEATHTSGLAWDGNQLWAADHESNNLYKIDPEKLFQEDETAVQNSYSTGLTAVSALTEMTVDDTQYLVLSDFVWSIQPPLPLPIGTAKTYVIPRDRVSELKEKSVPDIAVLGYSNGGYSQGLTFDGDYLYESTNNQGTDGISILDIAPAIRDDEPIQRLGSFAGPGNWIEDLGTDGQTLWTSDEGTYHIYSLDSFAVIRDRIVSKSSVA